LKHVDKNSIPTMMLAIMFAIILIFSLKGMTNFWNHANPDRTGIVQQAIQKAAVQCYALEGSYPPDIQYMVDYYGLQFNDLQYACRYEIFASNIMPEIEVYER